MCTIFYQDIFLSFSNNEFDLCVLTNSISFEL